MVDEDVGAAFLTVAFFVTILLIVVFAISEAGLERKCLAHGYPAADFRIIGSSYCIKRVNQTDSVISIDALEQRW